MINQSLGMTFSMMCSGSAGKEASAELSGEVRFQEDVFLPPTPWYRGVWAGD